MVSLKHLVKIVSLAFKNFYLVFMFMSLWLCFYFHLHPFYALHLFPIKVLPNPVLRLLLTMYPCLGSLLHKPIPSKMFTLTLRSNTFFIPKAILYNFLAAKLLCTIFFFFYFYICFSILFGLCLCRLFSFIPHNIHHWKKKGLRMEQKFPG